MQRLDWTLERMRHWDVAACARMNRAMRLRPVLLFFRAVSRLGDGVFWYVLMLALLLAEGREAALPVLHMIVTGVAATLAYRALKTGTLRPRPYQVHAHIAAGATPLDRFSFPSGHTLHAVAFSQIALFHYPSLAGLLIPSAVAVAASRIILGLHYPSDVLAGAALGSLLAFVSIQVL